MRSATAVPSLDLKWPPKPRVIFNGRSAAILSGDDQTNYDLQARKTSHHVAVSPRGGRNNGGSPQPNKAQPHHRNYTNRKRASTDYGRTVQKQPHAWQQPDLAIAIERRRQ